MLPPKPFYMIRHGETEANRGRIMAGSLDSPLTDLGQEQARAVQSVVKALDTKPNVIVHSNLSRSRDTAAIINEVLDVPMYENPDLAELYAGDLEGISYDACLNAFDAYETPPNGECFEDFFTRIQRGVKGTLERYDGTALIVVHGGVMRAMGGIYGLMVPAIFRNCYLYEFQPAPEKAPFPWDVYSYEDNPGIKRVRDNIYDQSKAIE